MKVLMLNGSPRPKRCTYTALCEIGKALESCGVEYEIWQLGAEPVRDCIACNRCQGSGCIFTENHVNEFIAKAAKADGFVFGSPVYFAHPSGQLLSFLDRAFYSCDAGHFNPPFSGKPAAAVVAARRGGSTAAADTINRYFELASMPIVTSTYWNMVHGLNAVCIGILSDGTSGVLALSGDEGYSYAVPLSYIYEKSSIYFHGAKAGHKIDAISRNDKVSFCVIGQDNIVPERVATDYRSVIVFGRIHVVEEPDEKRAAIVRLCEKYSPAHRTKWEGMIDSMFPQLSILRLDIEYMTGKKPW